jgi:uncharacterized protein (TIGR04255 family)
MDYRNPTLTEIIAELRLEAGTLPEKGFLTLARELAAHGFDDQEFGHMVVIENQDQEQEPEPKIVPRIRCWDHERIKLVQFSPDAVYVNLIGEYPGWDKFSEHIRTTRTSIESELAVGSLLALQPNRLSVTKVSSKESASDTLLTTIPNAVQAFFQRAESRLSAETEITAQYALKLLRRIRALVAEIAPDNINGRMFALVDAEDESTTIEWVRNRSRLGFVLDRENESSWFVVLPNGESKSGYLYGKNGLKSLRRLLEEFVPAE